MIHLSYRIQRAGWSPKVFFLFPLCAECLLPHQLYPQERLSINCLLIRKNNRTNWAAAGLSTLLSSAALQPKASNSRAQKVTGYTQVVRHKLQPGQSSD